VKLTTPGLIEEISISSLVAGKFCIRTGLGNIDGLVRSLTSVGLLNPIIVRSRGTYFEVIAGHRRLEAAKRLGWRKITCQVVELDDHQALESALVENVQQETMTVFDEANAFKRYVDEAGWGGVAELARNIGKSQTYVSRRISLLRLPENVKELIAADALPVTSAHELIRIRSPDVQAQLAEEIRDNHLNREVLREKVNEVFDGGELGSPYPEEPEIESKLALELKGIDKSLVALRVTLWRLGSVVTTLDEMSAEGDVKDEILALRQLIHSSIDRLYRLKKKLRQEAKMYSTSPL
jgi:ParB family chromosome partitioning protein